MRRHSRSGRAIRPRATPGATRSRSSSAGGRRRRAGAAGSVPRDSPENRVHRTGRPRMAARARQRHAVVHGRGGGDAVEMEQLVDREPEDVEDVCVECRDTPVACRFDGAVERRAPAKRSNRDLGGKRLVALVGQARAAALERGCEVGTPLVTLRSVSRATTRATAAMGVRRRRRARPAAARQKAGRSARRHCRNGRRRSRGPTWRGGLPAGPSARRGAPTRSGP